MGEAVGAMLASAAGLAINPLPLVAVVLVLGTRRARTNGPAVAAGWTVGLAGVVGTALAIGIGLAGGDGRPTWAAWLKLALGAALWLLALRSWRGRPRAGRVTAPPPWMRTADRLTAGSSFGLALGLAVADPRNLALAVGGAVSVAASGTGTGGMALAAGLLVLIGSLGTLVPLGVHLARGERADGVLGEWKAWTGAHNTAITTTVAAVLGAAYLGDALTGLA